MAKIPGRANLSKRMRLITPVFTIRQELGMIRLKQRDQRVSLIIDMALLMKPHSAQPALALLAVTG